MVDEPAHEGHHRLLAPRWHPISPSVWSSRRLSREASKAYRALSFASWTVMWSRWRAVAESSAMKGAAHCVTPPRIDRMTSCTTFGGARVLRHQ